MQPNDAFLNALRRPRPDPGGGAAAAHGALLGLALLEKIFRLEERRRPAESDDARSWRAGLERIAGLTAVFFDLRDRDVRAYQGLVEALARREVGSGKFADAVEEAVACPFAIMKGSEEALELAAQAGEDCKRHLAADARVACEFIGAALFAAFHIASANLPLIEDETIRHGWLTRLTSVRDRGEHRMARIRTDLER